MAKLRVRVGDLVLDEADRAEIAEVLDSGRISEGKKVSQFERMWARFVGTKYAVATSSGSAALLCGLTALNYLHGWRSGSKIITTPLTYVATSNAIMACGLEPVYVDVNPDTFDITPENILRLIEDDPDPSQYVAIMPVHLMGYMAKMDQINEIARRYGMLTFEDAAQAHGSVYVGRKAGAWGLLGGFSFYIAHNVQAGELGAITTNDPKIERLVRMIKSNGRACYCKVCTRPAGHCPLMKEYEGEEDFDPRFSHALIGYNFKTTEFEAALGISQLRRVDTIISKRRDNVRRLIQGLAPHQDILQLPIYSDEVSYLAFPIVIKRPQVINRKELRQLLEAAGIETRPMFGCIPTQQAAYSSMRAKYENRLPNADYLGLNAFYVGCHQYLSDDDIGYMIATFDSILTHVKQEARTR